MSKPKLSRRELLVLQALRSGELCSLDIFRAVRVAGGLLYPVFLSLERRELIESRWGDDRPVERGGNRRRYYKLTEQGRAIAGEP